jgi:hypothetical protein
MVHVNDLIGSRVWVKENSCPEYNGVIAAVLDPHESEDIEQSVNLTQFAVQLSSGAVVTTIGARFSRISNAQYLRESTKR